MRLLRRKRPKWLFLLIVLIVRSIGMTLRLTKPGLENAESMPGGKIYAGWHGRTFIAANLFRNRGFWTIISTSRDGELQNRVFMALGFRTVRGSSGGAKGGARAAIEAIRALRAGHTMAFTPDGPRGPSGVVQEGIITIAHKSGAPLIPVGVSAKRRKIVRSWDRFLVPLPFSKAIMIFGDPIYVPAQATAEELEQKRVELEQAMKSLETTAELMMGHTPQGPTCNQQN